LTRLGDRVTVKPAVDPGLLVGIDHPPLLTHMEDFMKSRYPSRSALVTIALAGLAVVLPTSGRAATTVWIGSGGGVYSNDANWSGDAPTAVDLPVFNNEDSGTISFTEDGFADDMQFRNSGTPGSVYTFDTGVFTLDVADLLLMGAAAGETTDLTLIGDYDLGRVFVGSTDAQDNVFTVTGSSTVVDVTGSNGLRVGSAGGADGSLAEVLDGATVNVSTDLSLGVAGAANATLQVSGSDSSVTIGDALQLDFSAATSGGHLVEILGGATVNAGRINYGEGGAATTPAGGSTIRVSGVDSSLNLSIVSEVGTYAPDSTLTIENEGSVESSTNITVGEQSTSTGNLIEILGGGELTITSGNRGVNLRRGTLNIDGGSLDAGFLDADDPGNSAVIDFDDGLLSLRYLRVDNGSAFGVGDGGSETAHLEFDFSGPTADLADGMVLSSNARVTGETTITGDVAGDAGSVFKILNDDQAAPIGVTFNTTTVNGEFDAADTLIQLALGNFPAELAADIANSDPFNEPFTQLDVNGLFTHGGGVEIDLTEYVAPQDMDYELQVIAWNSQSGAPAAPTFVGGGPLDYEYRTDGLYIVAAVPEPGTLVVGGVLAVLTQLRRRR